MKNKHVFIGGVGRSGTSVVREIFSKSDKVITFPFEYRFIIDPNGIVDFINSTESNWSPYFYEKKILYLKKFLKKIGRKNLFDHGIGKIIRSNKIFKNNISSNAYHGWELSKYFPNYFFHVDRLIESLVDFKYNGMWVGTDSFTFKNKILDSSHKDKEELFLIFNKFLKNLFHDLFSKETKDILIEDNTWNLLFADSLCSLFENPKFIHVYRDPRDVVSSYMKQRWMPSNIEKSAVICKDLYERTFEKTAGIPSGNLLELSLENLIINKKKYLKNISNFIGIEVNDKMETFNLFDTSTERYKKDIGTKEMDLIEPILRNTVEKLGYIW